MFYSILIVHHTLSYCWMWRWVRSRWGIRDVLPGPDFYGAAVGVFLGLVVVWCHIPMTQMGQSGQPPSLVPPTRQTLTAFFFLPGFILLNFLLVYSFCHQGLCLICCPAFLEVQIMEGIIFLLHCLAETPCLKLDGRPTSIVGKAFSKYSAPTPWPFFALPAKDGDNYLSVIT